MKTMKPIFVTRCLLVVILFLITNVIVSQDIKFNENFNTFKELKDNFFNPPAKYRTAPFYVWNDDITEQQIDEILTDYNARGIGGAFIHARPGLITEYISDKWNKLFKHAVEKGKSLGMQIWIYDENTYPSGNAGGNTPAVMPESSNQGTGFSIKYVKQFPDKLDKHYFVILKKEGDKFVEITNNYESEKGKAGDYYLCEKEYYIKSPWYAGNTYVDLLNPKVTKKFLEITSSGYEKNIKNDFGNTVPGMFTDEPGIYVDYNCWTPSMFDTFLKRWGYNLKTNLPCLNYEVGDWKKVRHDYYSTILDLFIDGFCKPYSEFCIKNNLVFTGHFMEHDWPIPSYSPDFMSLQAWEGMPGIDDLFNQYDESVHAQFGNIRFTREVRSVANQMGRTRTLSETYGGGGWDLRFQDMKRIADWQFAGGVNFVNQHLSQTTIKGWRKRDYPQSFSSHEPWWDLYRNVIDYTARMSLAMSSGKLINNTLVLEPTSTAWMYFTKNGSNKKFDELGPAFQKFLNTLESYQIEYDLGSEKNIEEFTRVDKGKFYVGQCEYGLIVIPPAFENFEQITFTYLDLYMKQGGKVVSYNGIPSFIDGAPSDKVKELAKQYPKQWININAVTEKQSLDILSQKDFKIIAPEKIKGKLLHQRRKLDNGDLLLLTNTSKDYWSKGTIEIKGKSVSELDANTGNLISYPAKAKGDMINIEFDIPQCGSLLLYINNDIQSLNNIKKKTEIKTLKPDDIVKTVITKPNTLTLDYCDLKFTDGTFENDIYVVNAGNKIFTHYGVKGGDPWSNPQYKTAFIDSNKFADNTGFEATYHLQIANGVDVSNIQVSVEQTNLWKLTVNGTIVEPSPNETWLDRHFGLYDIGKYLKEGNNELKVIATQMTIFSELESIYIIGKFGTEAIDKGFKIVPQKQLELGSWKNQGMHMYSNSVSYTNTFNIAKADKHFVVALDNWNGTVAEVLVNGRQAGVIYCEPYELDITDKVVEGANKISIVVYGSLKNLLGPHHSKVEGMAGPGDFAVAPKHQPSGSSYSLIDYGLFDNFKLMEVSGDLHKYYTKKEHIVPMKVSDPVITLDKKASDEKMKKIFITDETKGASIYYTIDGSEPTLKSKLYKAPFSISQTTTIKAIAFNNKMLQSNVSSKSFYFSINIINAVYKNELTKYSAGGNDGLFDGERGSEEYGDGKWQGFEADDMDITFELLKPQKIKKITVGYLESIRSWIYYPTAVDIYISTDGKEFKKVGSFTKEDISKTAGDPIKDISVTLNNVEAKYIRVFAKNIGKCPDGDQGSGGKAWIFTDEVVVE